MKNSALRNVTAILSKILEVVLWVATGLITFSSIVLTVTKGMINEAVESGALDAATASATTTNGAQTEWFYEAMKNGTAGFALFPFGIIIALTALIFRNIYLVFRKSNTDSPFSEANIKRIRNVGVLAIALPVAKVVLQILYIAIFGYPETYFSVSASDFVLGLVALCLSRYFAYGAQLERDVDGLL